MRIYFAGLGGVGIGPLAEIALDAGYDVAGSDLQESLMTSELKKRGVALHIGEQTGEFLRAEHEKAPFDWFIHTASLPEGHFELTAARQLGIPTAKRDEFLVHVLKEKELKLIAISGTHGKTTTTGMMVWTLQQLGIPVSYSIGTTISFGPSGYYDPASEYFVYECDEFDRNMLQFHPFVSLLTSLDYDHPDTYPTESDYLAAFNQFLQQSSHTIGWKHDLEKLNESSSWQLSDDEVLDFSLPGQHNRRNATLVVKACEYLKFENATAALNRFPGTNRRFEKLGENLYTDYGHHPVEIAATLQMARELSRHVVLVYQPHQNVRQHEVCDAYTDCMLLADEIYWLPTYLSRENPDLEVLSPQQLSEGLANKAAVHFSELDDQLWTEVQRHRDTGHLVLCMGAGSIDGWVRTNAHIKQVANVILITTDGHYILQQRDHKPEIYNPGMITGFGGSLEGDETPREGAARELKEETNVRFEPSKLEFTCCVYQEHVRDGLPRWVNYYLLQDVDISNLEVYEGEGYVDIAPDDNLDEFNLSNTARTVMDTLTK